MDELRCDREMEHFSEISKGVQTNSGSGRNMKIPILKDPIA